MFLYCGAASIKLLGGVVKLFFSGGKEISQVDHFVQQKRLFGIAHFGGYCPCGQGGGEARFFFFTTYVLASDA